MTGETSHPIDPIEKADRFINDSETDTLRLKICLDSDIQLLEGTINQLQIENQELTTKVKGLVCVITGLHDMARDVIGLGQRSVNRTKS